MLTPQVQTDPPLSLSVSVLKEILKHAKPLGHHEEPDNLNLGFGFVYYGLVRALRPRHILVIGSGFGFSVVCLALGQKDNGRGPLTFVDPSYSVFREGPLRTVGGTAYWDDPRKVRAHFKRFGVERIVTHHKLTSEQLFEDYDARKLPLIDLAFIDGSHAYSDVRSDFLGVLRHARRNSYVLRSHCAAAMSHRPAAISSNSFGVLSITFLSAAVSLIAAGIMPISMIDWDCLTLTAACGTGMTPG